MAVDHVECMLDLRLMSNNYHKNHSNLNENHYDTVGLCVTFNKNTNDEYMFIQYRATYSNVWYVHRIFRRFTSIFVRSGQINWFEQFRQSQSI